MSPVRILPLAFLAAASGLQAQIMISGAGGVANEIYSTAVDTTGGKSLSLAFQIEYLVVAGGGGGGGSDNDGGAWGGGGGGAGGMLTGSFNLSSVSANNVFTVTVGAGGAGGAMSSTQSLQQGGNGGNSVLGNLTALGGGGGGRWKVQGNSGGSGGGGGGRGTGNNLRTDGGAGTAGQGFAGGASRDDDPSGRSAGGGGGGAGGLGGQAGTDTTIAGNGGLGLASSITGTSTFYAAGGGGGAMDNFSPETAGTGGSGIGGNGSTSGNASAGAANTGSGGGGVGTGGAGGAGGSGIVVIRYKGSAVGSGYTSGTGSAAGYSVRTYTSGTSSLNLSSLNLDTRLGSVVSSDISGSGALTVDTLGTIRYTGTASHTGGTVITDGTLQLGNGDTSGSLGGAVSVASGAVLEYNRSADATFSSLSGSGDLNKKGSGRLAIGGSGGHTGKVTLSAGTLALGSSSALGAGTLDIAAGAALTSDGSSARSLSRDINLLGNATLGSATDTGALAVSGAVNLGGARTLTVASDVALSGVVSNGALSKAGAGKLTLSGANTYVGNTNVNAGSLVIDGSVSTAYLAVSNGATAHVGSGGTSGSLGTAIVGLAAGGTLVFNRSDDLVITNSIYGGTSSALLPSVVVKQGLGKLTISNSLIFNGRFDVREGELVVNRGSSNAGDQIWATISEGATYTLLNTFPSQGGYGSAMMSTSGAGQLVVKGTNRFAISSSTSFLASSLAHTGGTVVDGAGLLLRDTNALAQGSSLTVRGGGTLSGGNYSLGSVTVENGNLTPSSLTADSLQVATGYFSGMLMGATPLVKVGSGEFALYSPFGGRTGANRIEDGILVVQSNASLGQGATTVAGGSLRFGMGAFTTARMTTLVLDGGVVESDVSVLGTPVLDARVLDLRSGTIVLRLEGNGALSKTTAGTVTLSGDNSRYSGYVTVSDGVLRLLTTTSLGTASTVLLSGGTIELAGNTRVGYFEQTGGAITGGTLLSSLVLTESGTLGSVLADSGGASGILKRTSGTTQVTAANTFTGTVNIQQGTLQLDGAGSFNAAARLVSSSGGTLDLAGKAQTLAGIEGDGAIALGTGGVLTVSSSSSSTFDGSLGGDGSLIKSGTGTLRLTGAAAHTGGTSVTGGTLIVNGTLGAGAVTVASGTTLGGSGTIAGATTISGIHSPGNSPGLQTFTSSLTYQSGAEVRWELAAQSELGADRGVVFDGIDVAGDLTFSGPTSLALAFALSGSTVDWTDPFWASGHSWKVFDVGGSIVGFSNLTLSYGSLDSLGASLSAVRDGALFTVNLRSGDIFVDYLAPAPIPEPSTYGLILGGLALAGAAFRRQAQRRSGTAARN